MPLFGYHCDKCETEFELLVRSDSKPKCPECGSAKLVKLASAFAPMESGPKCDFSSACGSGAMPGSPCGGAHGGCPLQ